MTVPVISPADDRTVRFKGKRMIPASGNSDKVGIWLRDVALAEIIIAPGDNRAVGFELGRGRTLPEIIASTHTVAEGVKTTAATVALARRCSIEMPITQQVHQILQGNISPRDAIRELMERTLKNE